MSALSIDGAVLTRWLAVKVGEHTHLVGVLLGGHPRLAAGKWIITSPVIAVDVAMHTAVTASSGRCYHLLYRLQPPLPDNVADLLARIVRIWRLPPGTPVEFEL